MNIFYISVNFNYIYIYVYRYFDPYVKEDVRGICVLSKSLLFNDVFSLFYYKCHMF